MEDLAVAPRLASASPAFFVFLAPRRSIPAVVAGGRGLPILGAVLSRVVWEAASAWCFRTRAIVGYLALAGRGARRCVFA